MMKDELTIRAAVPEDAAALLEIYGPYVEKTAITFEYEVPSAKEFADRIRTTLLKYPYLVAEYEGKPVGYAYVGPFHARPAYDWDVETSIYLDENAHGLGLGRRLYEALEAVLSEQGYLNLYACIAYPETEDQYLTKNSVRFHAHLGYRMVGEFKQCGYKFGRWYGMAWMEKMIGEHLKEQPPVKPFGSVREAIREKYGIL